MISRRNFLRLVIAASLFSGGSMPACAELPPVKNIILMISDGAGINSWHAASYYRHGALGREVYDRFDTRVFMSTYPLNTSRIPTKSRDGTVTFDPDRLWGSAPSNTTFKSRLGNYPGFFSGYDYARADFTDSAAAATAFASGEKTYNNAINWSNDDRRLKHIGEYTVESGRALGAVTTVQWSHATPAGFLAHNRSRNAYEEIGREVIESGLATVVMGAGHPLFDRNGKARPPEDEKAWRYVGGREAWEKLQSGQSDYKLIESRADFQALAEGKLNLGDKHKLLGTFENSATTQFARNGVAMGDKLLNQPTLSEMTLGALNLLSRNDKGFFLMVEGGAVDWAAHANNLPRLIEEQIDFNEAVEAAVKWVEEHSSWDETLIIVTTDHGNGLLQGPDSDRQAYSDIISQGAGALPLVRWHTDNHTRELVPLYAKGKGADYFTQIAHKEPGLALYNVQPESRVYVDNTDVFRAAMAAFGLKADAGE